MVNGEVPQLHSERKQVPFDIFLRVFAQLEFGEQALADQTLEFPTAFDMAVQGRRRYTELGRDGVDAQPSHTQLATDPDDVVNGDERRSPSET
ncbi:hypothetical protein LRC484719_10790 [Mycobacterium riyadhense]